MQFWPVLRLLQTLTGLGPLGVMVAGVSHLLL